jgi:hypothetical protein
MRVVGGFEQLAHGHGAVAAGVSTIACAGAWIALRTISTPVR